MVKTKSKFNPADYRYQRIVIDASVLSKSFLKESGSDLVDQLMEMKMMGEVTVLATPLIVYELLNVLSKTLKDPERVEWAYDRFKKFGLSLIDPDDKFVSDATKDSCENRTVSYYDASYHALARDMDAVFITADERYYDAMKGKGSVVLFVAT